MRTPKNEHQELLNNVRDVINAKLDARGLSKFWMTQATGLYPATVYNFLKGRPTSAETVLIMMVTMEVKLEEIVSGQVTHIPQIIYEKRYNREPSALRKWHRKQTLEKIKARNMPKNSFPPLEDQKMDAREGEDLLGDAKPEPPKSKDNEHKGKLITGSYYTDED